MNFSSFVIPVLLASVAVWGMGKRVDVYSALTHGAEEGLTVLLHILPALVGLLTAVSMLRASGALDWFANLFTPFLNAAGIPHYTGADSFVQAGSFTTCGVNYTELGIFAAGMAMDILLGGDVPEFHVMDGGIITVNTDTAKALNIDYSVFSSIGKIVEVTTAG